MQRRTPNKSKIPNENFHSHKVGATKFSKGTEIVPKRDKGKAKKKAEDSTKFGHQR